MRRSKSLGFVQGSHSVDHSAHSRVPARTLRGVLPRHVRRKEALYEWLRKEHGQDLLSDDEVSQLLEYARYLFVLMKHEGVRPGEKVNVRTASGKALMFDWEDVTEIERLLWRSGQIENKIFSSD